MPIVTAAGRTDNRVMPLECTMARKKEETANRIAENRKARHEYFIDERYEAGVALQGWEVKALRAGRLQLKEGYVFVKKGEAWLFGAHILPLSTTSTSQLSSNHVLHSFTQLKSTEAGATTTTCRTLSPRYLA